MRCDTGGFLLPISRAQFADRDPFRVFLNRIDVAGQLRGRDPVNQSLYLWSKSMLPNYLLNMLGDRMEMAHSIEGRVPYLDHHVVEAVKEMPVSMKIHGMTEKYVLREAARDVLTDTVYRRQKHPFLAPPTGLQPEGRLSPTTAGHAAWPDDRRNSVLQSRLGRGSARPTPRIRRSETFEHELYPDDGLKRLYPARALRTEFLIARSRP